MSEIPQKGWYIHKDGNEPTVPGTKVYLDGKLVGGIQKLSIELDAEKLIPVLKLEVVAFQGLVWNTSFGELSYKPDQSSEATIFRSSSSPEEVLKTMAEQESKQEPPPESEVL
jgi:hypothetical protein